jgi:hypothetical protein
MTQQAKNNLSQDRINAIAGEFSLLGIDLNQLNDDQLNQVLTGVNDLIVEGKTIEQAVNCFVTNTRSTHEKQAGQGLGVLLDQQADLISDKLSSDLADLIWQKTLKKTWEKLLIMPDQPVNNFLKSIDTTTKGGDTVYLLAGVGK